MAARRQRLQLALSHFESRLWDAERSRAWWRDLRDVASFAELDGQAIWKISLAATQAPALLERLAALPGSRAFLDWGGALLWLSLPCGDDAQAQTVRAMLPEGAHAMLMVAPAAVRSRQAVFQPLPATQAAVEDRVRRSFDPERLLNPGRMV